VQYQSKFRSGFFIICSVWGIGVAVLALLNILHSQNGFLWPMGQDLDWSLILKQGVGSVAAGQEYALDHRNPLSAWFYTIASPLILNFEYGFHLLHLISCLMLGVSVYLLIWQFCRGRVLLFPAITGSIISLWWFWSNSTQVVSLMLAVLALSVLTVWSYCCYVDSERTRGIFYGWSITLWLLGISTYTIQCGAIIPIFLIAAFRGPSKSIKRAVIDILPYCFVGAAFMGIWIASAYPFFADIGVKQTTHFNISWGQLLQSMKFFIWHPSLSIYLNNALSVWSISSIMLIVVIFTIIVGAIVFKTFSAKDFEKNYFRQGAAWTLVTAIGLAIPTLLLEASSATWLPGTRSDMMYAAFVPMVFFSILIGITPVRAMKYITLIGASVFGSLIILLNLEQNRQGIDLMRWQQALINGIKPIQDAVPQNLHFIVMSEGKNGNQNDAFADRFVQDKLARTPFRWSYESSPSEVTMRLMQTQPAPANYTGSWRMVFEPIGVRGALSNSSTLVPYYNVRVVKFDGKNVQLLTEVKPQDVVGWQADFNY